tara:strand:+ start:1572 stop:2456 length:885 start_codon:yes stop_codon:yes gene_type:complete
MSVEDRAKELNSLSDKIRSSFTNFNSQFKSISDKRKRLARNIAERKERRSKLKSSTSSFGRSIGKISSNVLKTPGDIFGKVISFASLFLLGVLVNTIPKREQQLDNDLNKTKGKSEKVGNFFTGMVSAVQEFIGAFDRDKKTMENTLAGVEDSSKLAEREFSDLDSTFKEVEQFNTDDLSKNNNNDDDNTENDLDSKFKKKSTASTSGLRRDNKISQNYKKVNKLFNKEDGFLARREDLKDPNFVPFSRKDLINTVRKEFDRNRKIDVTDIKTEIIDDEKFKTIIIRQRIIQDP